MSATVIPFPLQSPTPGRRPEVSARVLILPVIRIERFDALARDAKLEGDVARELDLYGEDHS